MNPQKLFSRRWERSYNPGDPSAPQDFVIIWYVDIQTLDLVLWPRIIRMLTSEATILANHADRTHSSHDFPSGYLNQKLLPPCSPRLVSIRPCDYSHISDSSYRAVTDEIEFSRALAWGTTSVKRTTSQPTWPIVFAKVSAYYIPRVSLGHVLSVLTGDSGSCATL